jgi:hypothetical protein
VTTDTVYLTNYSGSMRQPVDVTYDDGERRITIQPRRPLPYGYQVIHIEGIADPSGNPLATTLALSTFWNSTRQYTAYAGDQISSRVTSDLTEDGLLELQTSLSGPGPDLDWGTSDDVISQLSDYDFVAPTGRYDGVTTHTGGAEAQWGTADDAIGRIRPPHYEGPVFTETVSYPGPVDGLPDTADDVVANRRSTSTATMCWLIGRPSTMAPATSPTVDQTQCQGRSSPIGSIPTPVPTWPGTPPTTSSVERQTTYSADGYRALRRGGFGADGVWATADDVINYCRLRHRRRRSGAVVGASPRSGVDGIWQTADDTIDVRACTSRRQRSWLATWVTAPATTTSSSTRPSPTTSRATASCTASTAAWARMGPGSPPTMFARRSSPTRPTCDQWTIGSSSASLTSTGPKRAS